MQHIAQLRQQSIAYVHDIQGWVIGEHLRQLEEALKQYNPNQPRVPRGNSEGGQWTSGGGGQGIMAETPKPEGGIDEKPLPPEDLGLGNVLAGVLGKVIAHALKLPEDSPITQLLTGVALSTLGVPSGSKPAKIPPLSVVGNNLDDNNDGPIDPVYPVEWLLGLGGLFRVFGAIGDALGGMFGGTAESDTAWTLGEHKSPTTWNNQMQSRGWTNEDITTTIQNGKPYPAPNNLPGRGTATRYEYNGKYLVRDDQTKEILQLGDKNFYRPPIPGSKSIERISI